ncbi:hypothetical protein ULMS_18930 [Patiriisocius marinistellae]|uniref:Calx-beta domain-containing protein n=1 Tax=Patiriisocius marinistellae TaxID=2494560 RepID=A0A5J4G1N8_9FLAO|nr:hypothetical protein [Patiriisocius marinistellae]GEQ86385.1 hypothetical protein ULMS_18930 [Patiriisocius marinistellae]
MKYFFFAILISFTGYSQVGIGTINPSPASMLDINSTIDNGATYQGLMPPKIPLSTDLSKINAGITDIGLMVFVQETGCLKMWNGATWEDIKCITPISGTEVSFDNVSQSLVENAGGITFEFTINNPSATTALIITISPNEYFDIDETNPVMVTIPAGTTNFTAVDVFNITDDASIEGNEQVVFTISGVSGGAGVPSVGTSNQHTLTIIDDDGVLLNLPYQESFETDGSGVRYITSTPEGFRSGNNDDYFSRAQDSDFNNYTGANEISFNGSPDGIYYFAAQDIDGLTGSSGFMQTLTISGIDITGGINLQLDVLLAEDDATEGSGQHWDGGDNLIIEYQIDGGLYQKVLAIESEINGSNGIPRIDTDFDGLGDGDEITDTWTNYNGVISGTGTTLNLRISFSLNSDNEDIAIDNIRISSN